MIETLRDMLARRPFQPFRVVLSSGESYEVRHPEFGWLVRAGLYVGLPAQPSDNGGLEPNIPDRAAFCALLHITAVEPIVRGQQRP